MIIVRGETTADYPAVRQVNELAFGQPGEADLVERLRAVASPQISLVLVEDDQVVGHIFFSPVSIEIRNPNSLAMGLAPMAVLPAYQKQGLGSRLVRAGLQECKHIGAGVVVVLGHPDFYPRFGFVPARQKELHCEYPVPDEVFMVIELKPGALDEQRGLVKYHPEFGNL